MTDFNIDSRLSRDVDQAEGNKLTAYLDTLGNWTIGRGHRLPEPAPGKTWEGFTILPVVSDRYFLGDLIDARDFAKRLPEWAHLDTDCRQNAIIEMCFNLRGRWEKFEKTRAAITAQDWQIAHDELLNSDWAHEVQPGGLDKPGRATRIAGYLLTGKYS